MLYGRFATSFVAGGSSGREVERERVAQVQRRSRSSRRYGSSDGRARPRARARHVREIAREDAEPGTDLEHDVLRLELGEPTDHAEDVLVDEEVLAELLLRDDVQQAEALGRVAVDLPLELLRFLAAGLRERRERVHHVGRLVSGGRARAAARGTGCRSRRGSGRRAPASRRGAARRLSGRYVAGERDVPAALERSSGASPATRSSGGRRGRRGRRARRACRRRQRACGSRRASRSRRRSRACARRGRAARRAVRSRGSSRARSRRRATAFGWSSSSRTSATSASVVRPASCGWMPRIAKTPSCASASSIARRQPAEVVPTVRIRATPASAARATTAAGSSSSASRCACVSIMRSQAQPGELLRGGLRRELAEERPRLLKRPARRKLARRPRARPARRSRRSARRASFRRPRRLSRTRARRRAQPS